MLSGIRRSLTRQLLVLLLVIVAVIAVVLVLLLTAIDHQRDAAIDAGNAEAAVAVSGELERLVVDLETGARGYVVTGDASFLDPYLAALGRYPDVSRELIDSASSEAARISAELIAALIDEYVRGYVTPLVIQARVDRRAAAATVGRNQGKARVDALRERFERLNDQEEAFALRKREQADDEANRALGLAIGGLALIVAMLAALAVYVRRSVIGPLRGIAAGADAIAAGDLEARVDDEGRTNELGAMTRSFNTMGEALERSAEATAEAERSKDEFFALVSHELRTPLTSIVGYAELLREDRSDPGIALGADERGRFVAVIERNARRLLRLVGDLLFVARLEAGKLDLERGEVELGAVIADSVEAATPAARAAGLELESRIAALPAIEGDAGRLGQAIDNLLANAIKFTPTGGSIAVEGSVADDELRISVIDSGIGIAEEEQRHLFERFFRASNAREGRIPGVGLGLVITRAIVEGHGGHLAFESATGRGTTFRLVVPARRP